MNLYRYTDSKKKEIVSTSFIYSQQFFFNVYYIMSYKLYQKQGGILWRVLVEG